MTRRKNVPLEIMRYLWIKLLLNLVGFWKSLQEQIWDRHREVKDLPFGRGKNIVITGGNRGIGYEAVKALILLGYHVIIGCRKPKDLDPILKSLKAQNGLGLGTWECLELDLSIMGSVRKFAKEVLAKNLPIHVLINNAGTMFGPREETQDGFESQMAVNHLGHFLLTHLLMPKLKATGTKKFKARIVNVSSAAHFVGSYLDFDDLHSTRFYSPEGAYGNSKAAQILFTHYLNPKLQAEEANVTMNCFHPGVVDTGLYQHAGYVKILNTLFCSFLMKTPRQGADSILYASISPALEGKGGLYLENAHPAFTSPFTRNLGNQDKLFRVSCETLRINSNDFGR